jgi:hypothetical protein
MRRKPGAFLEGTAEVEARQAGIRRQDGERDVSLSERKRSMARSNVRRQPTQGRLERRWRAGMRSQEARGQEICQLLPEQVLSFSTECVGV